MILSICSVLEPHVGHIPMFILELRRVVDRNLGFLNG